MRAHLLYYDFPTVSKLANPANFLRRVGAHVNNSVWIVPDVNVPRIPLKEWREKGARVELVRFDENDGDTIMRLAREAMAGDVERMLATLEASEAKVREKFAPIATGDHDATQEAYNFAGRYVRQAKNLLVAVQESATTFMLLGDIEHLCDGLRAAIKAKDAMYYAMRQQKLSGLVPMPEPVSTPTDIAASDALAGGK